MELEQALFFLLALPIFSVLMMIFIIFITKRGE